MQRVTGYIPFLLVASVIGSLAAGALPVSSPESGTPHLRLFPPKEIGGDQQVLVAAANSDGLLYFNSNRSVLEYDGVRWRRATMRTPPRSLAMDESGRVWVGCDGDFGYLSVDSPRLSFVSLRERLPEGERPTQLIRGSAVVDGSVYFLYTGRLLEWRDGVHRSWTAEPHEAFEAVVAVGDELFVYQGGVGLRRWPEPAPEPFVPLDGKVTSILPDGDGFLLSTDVGRIYRSDTSGTELFSAAAEPYVDGANIRNIKRLADGRIAVPTRGSGLLLLRADGTVEQVIRAAHGLPSDEIFDVVEDGQGSLWLGLSGGVVRMTGLPLTFYGQGGDGPGSALTVTRFEGDLYIGTLQGVFRLRPSPGPEPAYFERVPGIEATPRNLVATPQGLVVGTESGLFRVENMRVERLADSGRAIQWHAGDGVLWVAEQPDLRLMIPEPDGSRRTVAHAGVLPERVAEIVADDAPGTAWLITAGSLTIYRASFPDGLEGELRVRPFELPAPWPKPLRIDGRQAFYAGSDVLRVTGSGDRQALVVDPRFPLQDWILPDEELFSLRAPGDGELWLVTRGAVRHIERLADGTYGPGRRSVVLPAPLSFGVEPDVSGSVLWLATSQGTARLDLRLEPPPPPEPIVRWFPPTEVTRRGARGETEIAHSAGTYRFECAVPYFLEESHNQYRFRLVGLSDAWSDWTSEPVKEYTNLSGGTYHFEVETRHGPRPLGSGSFTFRVLPPWYETVWARSSFLLVCLGLGLFYVRLQRRKLERERFINRRLQSMDRLKDEFLANTSHELRTPLYGITGLAESLIDGVAGDLPATAKANLAMIVASGRRLSHLVNDILDISKLRHKSLALHRKRVNVHSVVEAVLALSRPLVGSKSLRLINEVPLDLAEALADENRLQQILHNLVGNAVKFTEQGTVTVGARPKGGRLAITVTDTGIGIPREAQERIFREFEQADASIEREHGGTGLGLAVTRRLVELHGGELVVESEVGKGSAFTLTLPVADAELKHGELSEVERPGVAHPVDVGRIEDLSVPGIELIAASGGGPASAAGEDRARILLVDDEPVNQQVLLSFLSKEDYEPVVASSGEEALRMLQEQRFDLVLLDVMMPKMSGYEVCRTLRRQFPLAELPVIFLTAKDLPEDAVAGLSLGANDYLTKPISRGELLARVRPHLELAHIHRRLEDLVDEKVSQIKRLRGLLPICASCKKIRDDEGYWNHVEEFIDRHSEAQLTHGLCPGCADEILEELEAGEAEAMDTVRS